MKNWLDFVNAADVVEGHWEVKADGRTIAVRRRSRRSISRRARRRRSRSRCRPITPEPGVEYWLNVSFALKADTLWAKKGFEVAWDQFALPWKATPLRQPPPRQPASSASSMMRAWSRFSGTDWALSFDKVTGTIASYVLQGHTADRARPAARLLARRHGQRHRRVEIDARFRRRERHAPASTRDRGARRAARGRSADGHSRAAG